MLQEFQGVRQEPGAFTRRRWFQDGGMDLIVWYDAAGAAVGFQLCYEVPGQSERALTWRAQKGFSHARVDGAKNRLAPILVQDGEVPWEWLQAEFTAGADQLEPAVRDLVLGNLATRTR